MTARKAVTDYRFSNGEMECIRAGEITWQQSLRDLVTVEEIEGSRYEGPSLKFHWPTNTRHVDPGDLRIAASKLKCQPRLEQQPIPCHRWLAVALELAGMGPEWSREKETRDRSAGCRQRSLCAWGHALHPTRALLAADPVSGCHAPAASITHPSVRRPVVAWPTRAPVAAHPNMAAASPIPIAREPDVTRCRSHPDYLHARRGRSDRHHAAAVIARCRSDNAAAQQGGRQQCRGSQNFDSVDRPHTFSKCLANNGLTHRDHKG